MTFQGQYGYRIDANLDRERHSLFALNNHAGNQYHVPAASETTLTHGNRHQCSHGNQTHPDQGLECSARSAAPNHDQMTGRMEPHGYDNPVDLSSPRGGDHKSNGDLDDSSHHHGYHLSNHNSHLIKPIVIEPQHGGHSFGSRNSPKGFYHHHATHHPSAHIDIHRTGNHGEVHRGNHGDAHQRHHGARELHQHANNENLAPGKTRHDVVLPNGHSCDDSHATGCPPNSRPNHQPVASSSATVGCHGDHSLSRGKLDSCKVV